MRVDHQMALAAGDPLATIVAALAPRFAGACGLAVDDRGMRFRTAAGQDPGSGAQDIVDGPPRAALALSPEMIVHALPGRKLVWQQAPGFSAAQDVEDGIQHPPQIVLARAPAAGCGGKEGRQDRPLRIAQVGVVAEDCHAPSDWHHPIFQTPSSERSRSSSSQAVEHSGVALVWRECVQAPAPSA